MDMSEQEHARNRDLFEQHFDERALVHAYGIEGGCDEVCEVLLSLFEKKLGVAVSGNPDMQVLRYGVFGVEEARALKARAYEKPFAGAKKYFVVGFQTITHEAQNALLKLFEEPSASTHFFLVIPSHELLLPTLRSRLYLLCFGTGGSAAHHEVQKFFAISHKERLNMLAHIIKEKDSGRALTFLNELEAYLSTQKKLISQTAVRESLHDVMRARGYLRGRAPSLKMLLENIALQLPLVSSEESR